jgi:membrane-associated protease RseP (regulator of RpoE activity)
MRTFFHVRSLTLAAVFLAVPSSQAQDQAEPQLDKVYNNLLSAAQGNRISASQALNNIAIAVREPGNEMLGATLTPLSDAMRAQLNVPAGQGILVASLRSDGPSAQAGLKRSVVLLTLAGKSLATADDLTKHLKAAGEAPVTLTLLRAGKQISLQVRPVYRVTLGRVGETKKEYYLGIALGGLDEALRSQLALPAGQGVIIANVVKGSPAEAAAIKAHDIVLELGGKSVDTPDKLAAQVQAEQGKPTTIKLLRAGKPLNIAITAAVRNVDQRVEFTAEHALRLYSLADAQRAQNPVFMDPLKLNTEAKSLQKIEELQRQIHSLRLAIDQLNALLKAHQPPKY